MFDTGRLTKYQISKILDGGRLPFWKWFYCYLLAADHLISMKFDADANFNTKTCHVTKFKILQIFIYNAGPIRNAEFSVYMKKEVA